MDYKYYRWFWIPVGVYYVKSESYSNFCDYTEFCVFCRNYEFFFGARTKAEFADKSAESGTHLRLYSYRNS